MKVKKGIAWALCLLCMTNAFSMVAFGETYESKEVDFMTGEAVDTSEDATRIKINDSCFYDKETDTYTYYLMDNNSSSFEANVPNQVLTKGPVVITCDESLQPELYKNNTLVDDADLSNITAVGSYALMVQDSSGNTDTELIFSIIGDHYCQTSSYTLPTGFIFTDVQFSGGTAEYTRNTVTIEQEGDYVLNYTNFSTDKSETLEFTIDRTPPTLTLSEVKNGYANGEVDISDLEAGASCKITLNGETELEYSKTLTQSGDYQIIVTDAAGNSNQYDFTIRIYFTSSSWAFIAVVIACAAGVVAYVYYNKKSFKAS